MAPIIEIKNLTKRYGRRTAVSGLDLTVEEGDIFGFVGPNGAGKTSTIRIMATLLSFNDGDILVQGYSVREKPREVRKRIGYMPDFFGVYNDLAVWEYLDFFGACYQIPENQRPGLIDDLLELVDLGHRKDDPVEKLSRGMKQRLSLARTLIHDPEVLILDEPASGLDPRARAEIRELLVELAGLGKTIFFSTHILADVAEICSSIGIIEAGELVAAGPLEELHQQLIPTRTIHITLLEGTEKAQEILNKIPEISRIELRPAKNGNGRQLIEIEFMGDDETLSGILKTLIEAKLPVLHFTEDSRNMESVFMRVTKGLVT
ncbi:MAG: ABC transporter ATP-binding protein [Anaerolineales bacterium]|nr:ABC transporter ATP-binding protein [Anaerolineales bacterium]